MRSSCITISNPQRRSRAWSAGAWIVCASCQACSDEQPEQPEQLEQHAKSATEEVEAKSGTPQGRVDIAPTMLSFKIDDEEQSIPASARLQLGQDGKLAFYAFSNVANKLMFSVRLAIPSRDAQLREQPFELHKGVPRDSEISLIRGELPNAISLGSVSGSAKFEHFSNNTFELKFDVGLSQDPINGTDPMQVSGNVKGGVILVCLTESDASDGVQTGAQSGQTQVVASLPSQACRAQLKKLEND